MTLRDLTDKQVAELQVRAIKEGDEWLQRSHVTTPIEIWRQAFSNGLKAGLAVQAQVVPKP